MIADRFEIIDDGHLTIAIRHGANTLYIDELEDEFAVAAIRQQARDLDQLRAECDILTHKVICCGVAAWHSDPLLTTTGAYAGKWNSPQADCVRKLRAERDQLRADLATAVSENAALLAANRDLKAHFDALKGDYDEAAHFARHFIRDDAAITPRGAIIRLGDKCTDLFVRLQQAEARLAAIEVAPMVARVVEIKRDFASGPYRCLDYDSDKLPGGFVELIARPAKDQE